MEPTNATDVAGMNRWNDGTLPGLLGIHIDEASDGLVVASMAVRGDHLAPHGYLHAATVIALADTAAGYGTMACLPSSASGFTTAELKSNFVGTARDGHIRARAERVHAGRSTQVWDATVDVVESGRRIALFRCTQFLLSTS